MVGGTVHDDGFKPSVPLSPQWLSNKHATAENNKHTAESKLGDPSTPKATDVDAFNRRGGGDKKDWWRTMNPGNGGERERWREDERETTTNNNTTQSRRDRWVEPSSNRDSYDGRRDGKWSNRWGPDEKDREPRRDKWDADKGDRYVPSCRRDNGERDSEARSWTSTLASRLPKPSASGVGAGAGRGREVGTVGFSVGRGRGIPPPGSYSAAITGPIGATQKDPNARFLYPRAKLLDIYRKLGGVSGFTKELESSSEVTLANPVDPLAFIAPDDVEKAAIDSLWKGEIVGDGTEADVEKSEVVIEEQKKVVESAGIEESDVLDKQEVLSDDKSDKPSSGAEGLMLQYIDPQGDVQGPFSGADIVQWFEAGYFGIDLLVRPADAPDSTPFAPLVSVMPQLVQEPASLPLANGTVEVPKEDELRGNPVAEEVIIPGGNNVFGIVPAVPEPVATGRISQNGLPFAAAAKTEKLHPLVHSLEELEMTQFQQLGLGGQAPTPRSSFPMQQSTAEALMHPGLHRAISADPAVVDHLLRSPQREPLQHQLFAEPRPFQHEVHQLQAPGLSGYGQESRMRTSASEQQLAEKLMQAEKTKQEQELLARFLQQKQERQLSRRLMGAAPPAQITDNRMSGVWEVDEFGQYSRAPVTNPLRGMETARLQHQSSLPAAYGDEISGYGKAYGYESQDAAARFQQSLMAAEMQKLTRAPQTRNELASLQALLAGNLNSGNLNSRSRYETAGGWGNEQGLTQEQRNLLLREHIIREQYAREQQFARDHFAREIAREAQVREQLAREHLREQLAREQQILAREQLLREHLQLAREKQAEQQQQQQLSSQEYILHQLARTQQLNELKSSIEQQVKQSDHHWPPAAAVQQPAAAAAADFGYHHWNGLQQNGGFSEPAKQALPEEFPVESLKAKSERPRMNSADIQACEGSNSSNSKSAAAGVEAKMVKTATTNIQGAYFRDITAKANSEFPSLSATVKRPPEAIVAPSAPVNSSDIRALRRWCEVQMKTFTGDSDLAAIEFALSCPTAAEAESHLVRCVGDKAESQAFRNEVLRCREVMTSQMLQVFCSGGENVSDKAAEAAVGKKKAKKGKKMVDPSLLGFSVASNRILMGEIQRFDDI